VDILLTALLAVLALCLTVVAAIAETAFTYLPHNEAEEAVEAHPDTLGARVVTGPAANGDPGGLEVTPPEKGAIDVVDTG